MRFIDIRSTVRGRFEVMCELLGFCSKLLSWHCKVCVGITATKIFSNPQGHSAALWERAEFSLFHGLIMNVGGSLEFLEFEKARAWKIPQPLKPNNMQQDSDILRFRNRAHARECESALTHERSSSLPDPPISPNSPFCCGWRIRAASWRTTKMNNRGCLAH